ncbi:MAG: hypothetical protein R2850_08970 [Bacteroidia bacterium]
MLVSPLDWGMGHATRCIPVIQACLDAGAEVIVCGSNTVVKRIQIDFPDLKYFSEELYIPAYSKALPAWIKILLQLPLLLKSERSSYARIQALVKNEEINIIISDNRYFVHANSCVNVLVSHQLNPRLPGILKFLQPVLRNRIAGLCSQFQYVWVPDLNDKRALSGALSVNKFLDNKIRFCGVLSRFKPAKLDEVQGEYDLLILSGPQPQPMVLFEKIAALYADSSRTLQVISATTMPVLPHVKTHVLPDNKTFEALVLKARNIICRPGYTTLMDLVNLNRTALLIPTPGQTEQEYLAKHLLSRGFTCLSQSRIPATGNHTKLPFPHNVSAHTKREENAELKEVMVEIINQIESHLPA